MCLNDRRTMLAGAKRAGPPKPDRSIVSGYTKSVFIKHVNHEYIIKVTTINNKTAFCNHSLSTTNLTWHPPNTHLTIHCENHFSYASSVYSDRIRNNLPHDYNFYLNHQGKTFGLDSFEKPYKQLELVSHWVIQKLENSPARVFLHCFLVFGYLDETLALVVHIYIYIYYVSNSRIIHNLIN